MPDQTVPVYNPDVEYEWNPDEPFVTLTGMEFASFYHMLMREMNNPGGAELAVKVECFNIMWNTYMKGIQTGKVYPKKQPTPEALKASDDALVKDLFPK